MSALVFVSKAAVIPAGRESEGRLQLPGAELALIGDIMDGEDGADVFQLRPSDLVVFKINCGQRGFPVVAVQNLGKRSQQRKQFNHCAAEHGEAKLVIIVSIKPGPIEEGIIFHEPDRNARPVSPIQRTFVISTAMGNHCFRDKGKLILKALPYALVQRRDDRHVVADLLQRRRK